MVECYFCGRQVADVDQAIDAGWIPDFWDGEDEVGEPVCPECCEAKLQYDEDTGDFERATESIVEIPQ